jgi:hypothetical protein
MSFNNTSEETRREEWVGIFRKKIWMQDSYAMFSILKPTYKTDRG